MNAVTRAPARFTGSAAHRMLRGALAEHDAAGYVDLLLPVCADNLADALDRLEAYEAGAPVPPTSVVLAPTSRRLLFITDTLVTLLLLAIGAVLWQVPR